MLRDLLHLRAKIVAGRCALSCLALAGCIKTSIENSMQQPVVDPGKYHCDSTCTVLVILIDIATYVICTVQNRMLYVSLFIV